MTIPIIPLLKPGDKVFLHAPARAIDTSIAQAAVEIMTSHGLKVESGNTLTTKYLQWSAPEIDRAKELTNAIARPDIKAIFMARGGYGCVRIIDHVDFSPLHKYPKWLVGFSDITCILAHLWQSQKMPSLHAPMLINFKDNTPESIHSIFQQLITGRGELFGDDGIPGTAVGHLIGGNLSVLYSLLGSVSFPDLKNSILILEDVDEYSYHIDRMLYALRRAGAFQHLAGLVVGSFTSIRDHDVSFGYTVHEIFLHHFASMGIPVAFGANIGHHRDQRAFIHGAMATLDVSPQQTWSLQWHYITKQEKEENN